VPLVLLYHQSATSTAVSPKCH